MGCLFLSFVWLFISHIANMTFIVATHVKYLEKRFSKNTGKHKYTRASQFIQFVPQMKKKMLGPNLQKASR